MRVVAVAFERRTIPPSLKRRVCADLMHALDAEEVRIRRGLWTPWRPLDLWALRQAREDVKGMLDGGNDVEQ